MEKDPVYECSNCRRIFTVRYFVAKNALQTGRPIACPNGHTDTNLVGKPVRHRIMDHVPPPEKPPTESQLKYIIALGGNIRHVKNIHDAGEYITKLKRMKEAC